MEVVYAEGSYVLNSRFDWVLGTEDWVPEVKTINEGLSIRHPVPSLQ